MYDFIVWCEEKKYKEIRVSGTRISRMAGAILFKFGM